MQAGGSKGGKNPLTTRQSSRPNGQEEEVIRRLNDHFLLESQASTRGGGIHRVGKISPYNHGSWGGRVLLNRRKGTEGKRT